MRFLRKKKLSKPARTSTVQLIFHSLAALGAVSSLIVSGCLAWLALRNSSGHTGLPVLWGTVVLQGLAVLVGVVGVCIESRKRQVHFSSASCLASGSAGLVFGVFLHATGIFQEYHAWLRAGQPSPPELKNFFICIAMLLLGLGMFFLFDNLRRGRA